MEKCLFGPHAHTPMHDSHHHHKHEHSHTHGEGDEHHHEHSHDYRSLDKRLLRNALAITFVTMVLEVAFGLISGSLALLSDAIHMFTHSFALGISYFAILMAGKEPPADKTFGYHRMEVLAAFVNAVTIGLSVVWILYEAVVRFLNPQMIDTGVSITVAVVGLLVNIATGVILMRGDMSNVNLRSAFLHMLADTVSSVAIIIGLAVIYYTGWIFIDGILAVMVAFVIARWSYGLFKKSVNILLEGSPVDVSKVNEFIARYDEVVDVHDIHIWEVTHRMYCISAHIVLKGSGIEEYHNIVRKISHDLGHEFNISHVTLQPEWA